jgi:hypothetical protein
MAGNEIKVVSPNKQNPEPEFYHIFKQELIPTFLKYFHGIEREGILPNSLYEASIIIIPKLNKDVKEKLQASL